MSESIVLRAQCAAELEIRSSPGADLHKDSVRSTWAMYGDAASRMRVWAEVIERYLARQPNVTTGGRLLVVTAGPPGAGKTMSVAKALASHPAASTYRTIDPDIVKDLLLEQAIRERIYEQYLREKLPDGQPIAARELSGLVHEESMRVARELRRQCMKLGENVIAEGTLSWAPMIDEHLLEVTHNGYDAVGVLAVDVSRETARERVLDRWWSDRNDPTVLLGGRFVPAATVDGCWEVPASESSKCVKNARELYRRALRFEGLETSWSLVDATGEMVEPKDHEGTPEVRPLRAIEGGERA